MNEPFVQELLAGMILIGCERRSFRAAIAWLARDDGDGSVGVVDGSGIRSRSAMRTRSARESALIFRITRPRGMLPWLDMTMIGVSFRSDAIRCNASRASRFGRGTSSIRHPGTRRGAYAMNSPGPPCGGFSYRPDCVVTWRTPGLPRMAFCIYECAA